MNRFYHSLILSKNLIRNPSVTPQDENCQELIIDCLRKIGFTCIRLRFYNVNNFWAYNGTGQYILTFMGHTDIVPSGPKKNWKYYPFKPSIKKNILYGRGSSDMKGNIASMIIACKNFFAKHNQNSGKIGFIITSDEEGLAINGSNKVIKWLISQYIKIKYCIVGEPSSSNICGDTIKNGRRGSLNGKLKINGIQGHIAYPQISKNPIHLISPILTDLLKTKWDNGNNFFSNTSFQISQIKSGTETTNIIPNNIILTFNFRFSNEISDKKLKKFTRNILNKYKIMYAIKWNTSGKPFLTKQGRLLEHTINSIKKITRIDTMLSTAGGTSDGRFMAQINTQIIELGIVNKTIHKTNESINIHSIEHLSKIYVLIINNLLA